MERIPAYTRQILEFSQAILIMPDLKVREPLSNCQTEQTSLSVLIFLHIKICPRWTLCDKWSCLKSSKSCFVSSNRGKSFVSPLTIVGQVQTAGTRLVLRTIVGVFCCWPLPWPKSTTYIEVNLDGKDAVIPPGEFSSSRSNKGLLGKLL